MRRNWLIITLLLAFGFCIVLIPLFVFSKVDKERVQVMGHWTGGFYSDGAQMLRGYLQLYRTGDKFKMRLASKDQAINFEGTWKIQKKRVELTVGVVDFENPTEENQKALGLRILAPEAVRESYGKVIALDLSADQTSLTGLTMKIADLQGRHEFVKGAVTPNTERAFERIQAK